MFLSWLAFLSPSIQLEDMIMAFGMIRYKVSCVNIPVTTLFSVGLLVVREKRVCIEARNYVPVWLTVFCLANELLQFFS